MKKIIVSIIAILLISTASVMASIESYKTVQIIVNGNKLETSGIIKDNRTLVPVRGVFEKIGYTVEWNANTKTAYFRGNNYNVEIQNGVVFFTCLDLKTGNSSKITSDVPQQIIDGHFYIPLRAVSESIKAEVDWDSQAQTAYIVSVNEETKDNLNNDTVDYKSIELKDENGKIGHPIAEHNDGFSGYKITCEPSTAVWTGKQDNNAYGFIVKNIDDMKKAIAETMDFYPRTFVFFSREKVEGYEPIITAIKLFEDYEISHGLHTSVKHSYCDDYMMYPKSKGIDGFMSAGEYYEYRIDLFYSAAGIVKMYRDGILSDLPNKVDEWPAPDDADYTILLNTVNKIEKNYHLNENSSDYDKVFAIYNYLTENVKYDYKLRDLSGNDAVDYYDGILAPEEINLALGKNKGVCFNYALTFQALCYVFDIDCYYTDGLTSKGDHAWNIVKVDGNWYQCDSTWDAGENSDDYDYFLLSDKDMKDHEIDYNSHYNYPKCPKSFNN